MSHFCLFTIFLMPDNVKNVNVSYLLLTCSELIVNLLVFLKKIHF